MTHIACSFEDFRKRFGSAAIDRWAEAEIMEEWELPPLDSSPLGQRSADFDSAKAHALLHGSGSYGNGQGSGGGVTTGGGGTRSDDPGSFADISDDMFAKGAVITTTATADGTLAHDVSMGGGGSPTNSNYLPLNRDNLRVHVHGQQDGDWSGDDAGAGSGGRGGSSDGSGDWTNKGSRGGPGVTFQDDAVTEEREVQVSQLVAMGFDADAARQALRTNNDEMNIAMDEIMGV